MSGNRCDRDDPAKWFPHLEGANKPPAVKSDDPKNKALIDLYTNLQIGVDADAPNEAASAAPLTDGTKAAITAAAENTNNYVYNSKCDIFAQCVECKKTAASTTRRPDKNADLGAGKFPWTVCGVCSSKVDYACIVNPCANECGRERDSALRFCKQCYSEEPCKGCGEHGCASGRRWCMPCIGKGEPGKKKPCSTPECPTIGCYREYSICWECRKKRNIAYLQPCVRCEKPKPEEFYEEGNKRCTRPDCKNKCKYKEEGELCNKDRKEGTYSYGGKEYAHQFCTEHGKPGGGLRQKYEQKRKAARAAAAEDLPLWKCKHCGYEKRNKQVSKMSCYGSRKKDPKNLDPDLEDGKVGCWEKKGLDGTAPQRRMPKGNATENDHWKKKTE